MKKFKLSNEDIKKLIESPGACIASDKITVEGKKVGYMYREEPDFKDDSGWRFLSGDEDDEYTDNPNNFEIYDVNTISNYDQDIISYLDKPIGTQLERDGKIFKEVTE